MENMNRIFIGDAEGTIEVKPKIETEKPKDAATKPVIEGERVFYGDTAGNMNVEYNEKDMADKKARVMEERKGVARDFRQQINNRQEEIRRQQGGK